MLNLVYEGSRDEAIYDKLSERMHDKFDIFGQLPDTLSDDWIDDEQGLERELRKFVEGDSGRTHSTRAGETPRPGSPVSEAAGLAEGMADLPEVLSRRDIENGWGRGGSSRLSTSMTPT